MKTCPSCKRDYSDETQTFCLEDGTRLFVESQAPTLVSFQPLPTIQPPANRNQPLPTQAWTPPQPSAPPEFQPPPAATFESKRRMGLATVALLAGFVCLALMIHLSYVLIGSRHAFGFRLSPRIAFDFYGVEFLFGVALVAVTVVLAGIAITLASKSPTVFAGRGRSLAAILMGVLSTFVVVSLFSYRRLHSPPAYSTTTYTPSRYTPSSTPTPSLSYPKDFIKPTLGSFSLIKSLTRNDVRKMSSGEMASTLDRANDLAAGIYQSQGAQNLSLIVSSYSNPSTPAELVNATEKDMHGSSGWRSARTVPRANGKRIEAEMSEGGGLVVWNNGYWLFITYGPHVSDAAALADTVGY